MRRGSPPRPQTVGQLIKLGYEVVVESGAGVASSFSDEAYVEAGRRRIGEAWAADVVFKVNAPSDDELAGLRDGRDAGQPDLARR